MFLFNTLELFFLKSGQIKNTYITLLASLPLLLFSFFYNRFIEVWFTYGNSHSFYMLNSMNFYKRIPPLTVKIYNISSLHFITPKSSPILLYNESFPLTLPPGIHWSVWLHSFAFFGITYKWNHLCLASFHLA